MERQEFHMNDVEIEKDVTYYFLNKDFGESLTGIEISSLLRAKLFQKKLGINPILATAAYNPRLQIHIQSLRNSGQLNVNCKIINLYEFFQEVGNHEQKLPSKPNINNDKWLYKPVDHTKDNRTYDEKNNMILYRKCDENGLLMYNNIFLNKKKVRRDTFDPNGFLSRTQHLDPITGKVTLESYHRRDGSVCLYKYYKFNNDKSTVEGIHLIDKQGETTDTFQSETDLISFWLEKITESHSHSFFIIDKERVFYPALQKMDHQKMSIVCMIHSSHLQKDQDVIKGNLNSNYRLIFEDLSIPDAVIFLTNRQKKHVEDRFGPRDNLLVIPHFAEDKPKVNFDRRIPLKAIYLARYSEEKQHENLIRVFHKVVQVHPTATLHFWGHGKEKHSLIKLIHELALENNIFVNDFTGNLDPIYDSASLAILPSKVEGISLFLLESLSHGCPIVSYNINYGPEDIIDDAINGYLVEPQNQDEMTDRIVNLFWNRKKLEEMSMAAYTKAATFQEESIAEKWASLIKQVLESKYKHP